MPKFYKTKHRIDQIERLNRSVRSKQSRLKRLYGVEIQHSIKGINDFKSGTEYKEYVKTLQGFTDYNAYRYVKLETGDILPYQEIKDLQKANRERNKVNRDRLKKALKIIKEETGESLNLYDFDNNPDLYRKKKLSKLQPIDDTIKDITAKYQLRTSIKRAEGQAKKVQIPSYYEDSKRIPWENFLQSLKTEFGSFPAHIQLYNYVQRKGYRWFYRMYISDQIPVFEYMYKYEDYKNRFIYTMHNFGFSQDSDGRWKAPQTKEDA